MSTKATFLIIDTETTGLNSHKHGLIQLGAVAAGLNFEVHDTLSLNIKPPDGYEVSPEAQEIHGIPQEVIDGGVSYQEALSTFWKFIKKNFEPEPICVGQFFPFDYSQLQLLYSADWKLGDKCSRFLKNDFIDTKVLVNFLNLQAKLGGQPLPFPVTSLSKPGGLKDVLGIDQAKYTAHDALGDCLATLEVLKKLSAKIEFKMKTD